MQKLTKPLDRRLASAEAARRGGVMGEGGFGHEVVQSFAGGDVDEGAIEGDRG